MYVILIINSTSTPTQLFISLNCVILFFVSGIGVCSQMLSDNLKTLTDLQNICSINNSNYINFKNSMSIPKMQDITHLNSSSFAVPADRIKKKKKSH